MLVELGGWNLLRARIGQFGFADRVDGEAAQVFPQVAPGVEIPVVAVMHQALRRHFALCLLVVLAVVVADPELRALQHGGCDNAEILWIAGAALGLEDTDALLHFFPRVIAALQDAAQAIAQRLDLALEHAGLHVAEEAQRREEREHLGSVEPESGQLVAWTGARRAEAVAVGVAVILDWRV